MSFVPITDNSYINDVRSQSDFKGISFSEFKKTEVKKQFIEAMFKGKIEPACYWCVELICAGHFNDLWECIFHYMGKHIHSANPKIAIYLEKRYEIFENIIKQKYFINEFELRNNIMIRKLFAEITTILTTSHKKNSFEKVKIIHEDEFDITMMSQKLKASNMSFAEPIFQEEDPKELFIPINEFAYHISSDTPNMLSACYWMEWIIEFDAICRKRKENCFGQRRDFSVEYKYKNDIIWIIWDVMKFYSKKKTQNVAFIESVINSLSNIFCVNYKNSSNKKHKYLLYFAIELLTENITVGVEIVNDKNILSNVIEKINNIYKQIKKNENSPNMDYLFSNIDETRNYENTVKKLELMKSMDFVNF